MDALVSLAAASAAFVGTHFLLSHPLRKPIVARAGEGAFTAIYGGVAGGDAGLGGGGVPGDAGDAPAVAGGWRDLGRWRRWGC